MESFEKGSFSTSFFSTLSGTIESVLVESVAVDADKESFSDWGFVLLEPPHPMKERQMDSAIALKICFFSFMRVAK